MQSQLTPTVVGIDVGSFTSKVAAVNHGTVDIITNQANFRETPSVIGYGEGERKLGELGTFKLKSNSKNTIVSPSRYLGLTNASCELVHCPCPARETNAGVTFGVDSNGQHENLVPEQVLAGFMGHLGGIVTLHGLDSKFTMFAVPSFYTEIQKRAFLAAAAIAGLSNYKLVTETIAIGLDYGGFKKSEMGNGKNVLFVDFGHSKLSASFVRFTESKMDIIFEKANRNLGCRDIDIKVVEYLARKFEAAKGLKISESKRAWLKVVEAVEKQRKILSGIAETEIHLESVMEDEDLSEPLTRDTLYEIAQDIFAQVQAFLNNVKDEFKKLQVKYDSVELIGGGSRIPRIISIIQEVFQVTPSRTTNSSQAIARGATLAAVQQSGLFRFHCFNISNRIDYGIKLLWADESGKKQKEQFVIEFNEQIPCEKTIKLGITKKTDIDIICNVDSNQVERKIGTITCEGAGEGKAEINCTFKISEEGFVVLSAVKGNDAGDIKFSVAPNRVLNAQQIEEFKTKEAQMCAKDLQIVKSYEKKNELQSFIYKQKQHLGKEEIKKYGKPSEIAKIENYLNSINNQMQGSHKMDLKDFQKTKNEIEEEIKKLEGLVKNQKQVVNLYFHELEQTKNKANEAARQIMQSFRNSEPVQEALQALKDIELWADQVISASKDKPFGELPMVSREDIQQQNDNIKTIVNRLQAPPPATHSPPRHQHFEEHYDPEDYMYRSQIPFRSYHNNFFPSRMTQKQQDNLERERQQRLLQAEREAERRKQQQSSRDEFNNYNNYSPFGMGRRGLFGPQRGRQFWDEDYW